MKKLTFTIIFLLIVTIGFSQRRKKRVKQRFKAGLAMGANLSQINGDLFSGYDKWGLQFGARGVIVLRPTLEASVELLYSQRGSKGSTPRKSNLERKVDIGLAYAEVPFIINFLRKENEDEGFYHNHWHFGVSYSRLLNTKVDAFPILEPFDEVDYEGLATFYKSSDLAAIMGVTHYVSKHLGFTLRHTISITNMYENMGEDITGKTKRWRSFFFSAHVLYMF